ncbi:MAG: hypothetical protein V3U63_07540, partial [Gemmatimonadota bacterium]
HVLLYRLHAESCDTLLVDATQELVHVREIPLKNLQQRRADLRGQALEVKAFQHRTQMFLATGYEMVPFRQIPRYNLQFARRNLLE